MTTLEADFDRNLIGCTTNAAGANLNRRSDILKRLLEHGQRIGLQLRFDDVERAGQKKIVIGAGGARIKAVGSRARAAIERLLGRKVFLELWVKVTPDWTRSPEALSRFGYSSAKRKTS